LEKPFKRRFEGKQAVKYDMDHWVREGSYIADSAKPWMTENIARFFVNDKALSDPSWQRIPIALNLKQDRLNVTEALEAR
jgi:hypothetical protein